MQTKLQQKVNLLLWVSYKKIFLEQKNQPTMIKEYTTNPKSHPKQNARTVHQLPEKTKKSLIVFMTVR